MKPSNSASNVAIDHFLKNLPDDAVADAYISLIEYEIILKEQFVRTIHILKDIEKRLKNPEVTGEKLESLQEEFETSKVQFEKLIKKVHDDIQLLRAELKIE